jgi:hypothetical protein
VVAMCSKSPELLAIDANNWLGRSVKKILMTDEIRPYVQHSEMASCAPWHSAPIDPRLMRVTISAAFS